MILWKQRCCATYAGKGLPAIRAGFAEEEYAGTISTKNSGYANHASLGENKLRKHAPATEKWVLSGV